MSERPPIQRIEHATTVEERELLFREGSRVGRVGTYLWEIGRRAVWSDELFELLGFDPDAEEIDAERFFGAVHPEDREAIRVAYAALLRGEDIEPVEYRIIQPDGSVRYVRGAAERLPEMGDTAVLVGTIIDITERRDAELRAEVVQRTFAEAARNAGVGSFVVELGENRIHWTPGLFRITGLDPSLPVTPELGASFLHPDDRERNTAWFFQLATEGAAPPIQVRAVRPDGWP